MNEPNSNTDQNLNEENPYDHGATPESLDGQEATSESCGTCARVPTSVKLGLIGVVVALLTFNALVYASPSLANQISKIVPESLMGGSVDMSGHDRGCGCSCSSHCETETNAAGPDVVMNE